MRCEKSEETFGKVSHTRLHHSFPYIAHIQDAVPNNLVHFASQVITVMTPFLSIFGGGGYAC